MLFFAKNTAITQTIDKPMTILDVYPTLLELLGYRLKDGQANLGVSMLSDTLNLAERYGSGDIVSNLFKNNHPFADYLWRIP